MTAHQYLIAAQKAHAAGFQFFGDALIACYLAAKRREAMFGTSVEQSKKVNA